MGRSRKPWQASVTQPHFSFQPQYHPSHFICRWGGAEAPDWLTLRALLLTAPPATITALFPRAATAVLGPVAGDHEGDPALRLSVLALVDALLEDPVRGAGEVVSRYLLLLSPV
jgi:hypothetical protein